MFADIFGQNFELRLLTESYNVSRIVENYESFVWAERFNNLGDFQLKMPAAEVPTNLYRPGRYLDLSVSDRLMIIETAKTGFNNDGIEMLEISGLSFESVLKERVVTTTRKFTNSSPGWIATEIFREICIRGDGLSNVDRIPNTWAAAQSPSTIQVDADIRAKYLYDAIKDLCDSDDLGFKIEYVPDRWDGNFLVFNVYRGDDRTSARVHDAEGPQAVVFASDLDNLNAASSVRTNEGHKSVAYVWHDDRSQPLIVLRRGAGGGSYLNRRVLSVDANDIENPTTSELEQRGREALSENRRREMVDGEADYLRSFVYGRDYFMGDLVEVWYPNADRVKSRVTEHIWSFDSTGLKAYPTLEYVEHL